MNGATLIFKNKKTNEMETVTGKLIKNTDTLTIIETPQNIYERDKVDKSILKIKKDQTKQGDKNEKNNNASNNGTSND